MLTIVVRACLQVREAVMFEGHHQLENSGGFVCRLVERRQSGGGGGGSGRVDDARATKDHCGGSRSWNGAR